MKRVFKFLFNVIRNTSLIIVVGLISFFTYLAFNEDKAESMLAVLRAEEYQTSSIAQENTGNLKQESTAINEPPPDTYKSKKIKIKVKGGFAYLRPSQVMYANSGDTVKIMTTNEIPINAQLSLTALDTLLAEIDEEECFFRIKSAIINCKYVMQLAQESKKINDNYNYQHIVVMEDGEKINISPGKANELFAILENMTF